MQQKLGVVVVGVNGAVSSTLIAGARLMANGLAPRLGMLTEPGGNPAPGDQVTDFLQFPQIEDVVFAGWDLAFANVYEAAIHHNVLPKDQLDEVKGELEAMAPWPAVFSGEYAENCKGENVVTADDFRGELEHIEKCITKFKADHDLDTVVMVNLASTERWMEMTESHETLAAFEKGLDDNDPSISPAMRYFYIANKLGVPYCNFAPSLTNVPALEEQANELGNPYAGMDGKTGQTLLKTALAAMFKVRNIKVDGWYSVNFLGNNDGLVLDSPSSNKTKVLSKAAVLDSIVGYRVENHQVHIHYYKPRGDAKEAWDNIDMLGFAGVPMQMKINFLCQDSILAAPLVMDLVRLLDAAKRKGEKGIQRQLSLYFKSPYTSPGEQAQHNLFDQEAMLIEWAKKHADK
ncbi:MAG TPA: inositol-3-phosphate synthase [Sandaracinaceae bacterium LLY-WYZ-13_1]|nr:inositol-3-phosphate synthase [Sandaracinaceae bacterium LLY-WYZ-13_1]